VAPARPPGVRGRPPPGKAISEAHTQLGAALRATRERAGISTRAVEKIRTATPPERAPAPQYFSSGHISSVEAGLTAPSPELIEAYGALPGSDPGQLRSLHERMVDSTRAAARRRRQGDTAKPGSPPPRSMEEVGDRHDVQRHYVVVATEAEYRFGPTGAIREVKVTVALRATTDGVGMYYTGFNYPADQRRGVLRAEAGTGAELLAAQESPSGALGCYFQLGRTLSPEDRDAYRLSFGLSVHSEARAVPCLAYFPTRGGERLQLRSSFDPAARPEALWWFSVPDLVDAEHPVPGRELSDDPAASFARSFDRLVPGWCYGVAWTW
jgi:hypothetical protein